MTELAPARSAALTGDEASPWRLWRRRDLFRRRHFLVVNVSKSRIGTPTRSLRPVRTRAVIMACESSGIDLATGHAARAERPGTAARSPRTAHARAGRSRPAPGRGEAHPLSAFARIWTLHRTTFPRLPCGSARRSAALTPMRTRGVGRSDIALRHPSLEPNANPSALASERNERGPGRP